jgi:hypothetical protein
VIPSSGVQCIKILSPQSTLWQTPETQWYPTSESPYLILRLPQCCFLSFLDLTKYLHYFKWINKFLFQILLLLSELHFELTHKITDVRDKKSGGDFLREKDNIYRFSFYFFSFYFFSFFFFHFIIFFFFFSFYVFNVFLWWGLDRLWLL